nr:MAG TPA: hypothetical protein [Caudoviricetes sp.]
MCYPKGFLSFSSISFDIAQHSFSSSTLFVKMSRSRGSSFTN